MITAQELRIGNWVRLFLGFGDEGAEYREFQIQGIMNEYCSSRYLLGHTWIEISNNLEPIELSEEWLLKFGFKKKYKSYEKGDFMFLQGGYDKLAYNLSIVENTPRYVHQLQNLYWILCGEELEINFEDYERSI